MSEKLIETDPQDQSTSVNLSHLLRYVEMRFFLEPLIYLFLGSVPFSCEKRRLGSEKKPDWIETEEIISSRVAPRCATCKFQ